MSISVEGPGAPKGDPWRSKTVEGPGAPKGDPWSSKTVEGPGAPKGDPWSSKTDQAIEWLKLGASVASGVSQGLSALQGLNSKEGSAFVQQRLKDIARWLPPPGAEAAMLVGNLLSLLAKALENRQNLKRLNYRAMDLLDVVIEHLSKQSEASYHNIMGRFVDLLQELLKYFERYTDRHFLMRLITASYDSQQYTEYAERLNQLTLDATFSITLETQAIAVDIQGSIDRLREDLTRSMVYTECGKPLKDAVERLGGLEKVLQDDASMREALRYADASQQISAQLLKAAMKTLEAELDKGIHRNIPHLILRTFWNTFFNHQSKVKWELWWLSFPSKLDQIVGHAGLSYQLDALLSEESSKIAFQFAVERSKPDSLDIHELIRAFPEHTDLVERTTQLLLSGASASAEPTPASTTSFMLPANDKLYCGRAAAAEQVQRLLLGDISAAMESRRRLSGSGGGSFYGNARNSSSSFGGRPSFGSAARSNSNITGMARCCVLLGIGGIGKSSLANDVGHRMSREGYLPAGAMVVDLRGACTKWEVEGRFCITLGIKQEYGSIVSIQKQLNSICSAAGGGPLLLVVSHAEAFFQEAEPQAITDILQMVITTESTLMIVTTRVPAPSTWAAKWEVTLFDVPPIQPLHARDLVKDIAKEAAIQYTVDGVADTCCGVPLLTRMVADALAKGVLDLTDLHDWAKPQHWAEKYCPQYHDDIARLLKLKRAANEAKYRAETAPLPDLATFDTMTVRELRSKLDVMGIDHRACVEKVDLVKLLKAPPSKAETAPLPDLATFDTMTVRELRSKLDVMGIDHRACVEKVDLVKLLKAPPSKVGMSVPPPPRPASHPLPPPPRPASDPMSPPPRPASPPLPPPTHTGPTRTDPPPVTPCSANVQCVLATCSNGVCCLAFSPNGSTLASGHCSGWVNIWRTVAMTTPMHKIRAHAADLVGLAFSTDGHQLATASSGKTPKVWVVSGAAAAQLLVLTGHKRDVTGVAFSPDDFTLATCDEGGSILLWNAKNGTVMNTLKMRDTVWRCVAFAGCWLVAGTDKGVIHIADVRLHMGPIGTWTSSLVAHTGKVLSVSVSQDGQQLASTSSDCTVVLWSLRQGVLTRGMRQIVQHNYAPHGVAFSADGSWLVSADKRDVLRWNAVVHRPSVRACWPVLGRDAISCSLTDRRTQNEEPSISLAYPSNARE